MANLNLGFSAVATGTADVITATYSPLITLSDRRIVFLQITAPNTITTPTFAPDGLTAHTIKGSDGQVLKVGELKGFCILVYHVTGTYWELITSGLTRSTLAQILLNGASTGNLTITSPDGLSKVYCIDDELTIEWGGAVISITDFALANPTYFQIKPSTGEFLFVGSALKINGVSVATGGGTATGTNTGDETAVRIATINHGTSAKTTPVDADEITGQDSAASFGLIRVTFLNLYNYIKAKADLVYATIANLNLKTGTEPMFGSSTVFSPLDSTVTYVGISTTLAPNNTASTRPFQGWDCLCFGMWLYVDPTGVLGSTEDVTYDIYSITDTAVVAGTTATIKYDARGKITSTIFSSPVTLSSSKYYAIRITNPAYATNPTNVIALGKILIR